MSESVALDGGSPGNLLANAGTSRASSEPCSSTCASELLFGRVRRRSGRAPRRTAGTASRGLPRSARTTRTRPPSNAARAASATRVVLPRPGLTRDEQHLASLACDDALERVGHRRRLGIAPDDTRRGTHASDGPATAPLRRGPAERLPAHLDRVDRIGQALQLQRPDADALVLAAPTRHRPHDIRREDLTTVAPRAEPSGLDHRIAEVVVVFCRDFAAAQPDPQARPSAHGRGCRVRCPAASRPRTTTPPTSRRTRP